MMSGGWDSRTLLGALASCFPAKQIRTYSHGDINSRELKIVRRLSASIDCLSRLEPLQPDSFSASAVHDLIRTVGDGYFPHWFRSGQILKRGSDCVVSSGVLGEVMGGHYGHSMVTSGTQKIAAVAAHALGVTSVLSRPEKADPRALLGRGIAKTRPWFIHGDAWPELSEGYNTIRSDIDCTIARLQKRGIRNPESIIESAITELRGAQYIAGQARSIGASLPISMPFADYKLLLQLTRLPMNLRIHNSLNRRLVKRFHPALLQFPTAATLVKASSPILMQEAGRAARRLLGKVQERAYSCFSYPTRLQPRLSWVDFEFLRNGARISTLVESLQSPITEPDRTRPQDFGNSTCERAAQHSSADRYALEDSNCRLSHFRA